MFLGSPRTHLLIVLAFSSAGPQDVRVGRPLGGGEPNNAASEERLAQDPTRGREVSVDPSSGENRKARAPHRC